jgi:hypothetical protein
MISRNTYFTASDSIGRATKPPSETRCQMLRRLPRFLVVASILVLGAAAQAQPFSGQRAIGRATVEPAVDDSNGSTVYLLTPDNVPFPSQSNPRASAPLYLVMYPTTSTIDAATLNCQPNNCDHVQVLPFPAPGYTNGGTACTNFGFPAGGCALVKGHDHLIGLPHTGDFNIAWHVYLVVFTPKGLGNSSANTRVLTLAQISSLVAAGDAFLVDTPITFNCSVVPETVYLNGTPLNF